MRVARTFLWPVIISLITSYEWYYNTRCRRIRLLQKVFPSTGFVKRSTGQALIKITRWNISIDSLHVIFVVHIVQEPILSLDLRERLNEMHHLKSKDADIQIEKGNLSTIYTVGEW